MKVTTKNLGRYKDIALFLLKVGRSDLLRHTELEGMVDPKVERAAGDLDDPKKLVAEIEGMGPTFIKLGQLLSTRADLIAEPYLKSLSRLQDNVEPFPFEQVEKIIQTELGARISKIFSEFGKKPIAAASLGQVHLARLRDERQVAVKVQRPDVRQTIAKDLEIFEDVASYLDGHTKLGERHRFELILDEFRRMLLAELDYQREARNLVRLSGQLESFERIVVPLPIEDLTSPRVLTMEYVEGRKISAISPLKLLEIEGEELTDQLLRAYLNQILVDGTFHADPHPGNLLLTPEGRLALIDLGMVAHFSEDIQERLLQLLMHLSEGHSEKVSDMVTTLGHPTPDFDREPLRRKITDLVGEYVNSTVEDIPVGRVILRIARIASESGLRLPSELFVLGKVLSNLDEVGRVLAPEFRPDVCVKRNVLGLFQKKVARGFSPGNVLALAMETKDFAQELPGRINRILDTIGQNRLAVRVEGIDQPKLLEGFQKIANRITMGLVLAAMIIGAAMLMNIDTPLKILGYPAFAILLFLMAAGGGVFLLISIIYNDRNR